MCKLPLNRLQRSGSRRCPTRKQPPRPPRARLRGPRSSPLGSVLRQLSRQRHRRGRRSGRPDVFSSGESEPSSPSSRAAPSPACLVPGRVQRDQFRAECSTRRPTGGQPRRTFKRCLISTCLLKIISALKLSPRAHPGDNKKTYKHTKKSC